MKILALFVLQKEGDKKVKILQDEFNLDSFGFFERRGYVRQRRTSDDCMSPSRVQQLLVFSARTVTERTTLGTRQSVEADENVNGKPIRFGEKTTNHRCRFQRWFMFTSVQMVWHQCS